MLKNLKVKEIMTENVITVTPGEEVVFAFEKLMKHKISALPVIDDEKLVGIVTASDLGHNLVLDNYELGTIVEKVMITDVTCVEPDDTLDHAIDKMNKHGSEGGIINQLVVINKGKIEGIVSDGDIIKALK
ncbi:MAG: CBS domain-containing protein [Methanobacteriaceae archaeon]|nr:CBS domain-containing protein [Methanobacteriaceae archaeon]MDP2835479.1 CBS domain-containing protein [Methanobacteriaceae archaeon]MDP3035884.1 CBS domain-containing protein [Methanobacteriaceae archaeon]MDP3485392.1 CBS domain-containing protein [Methanobacteriaceae archaeon]MDP3622990.1 CBS domain-containing protein [Methanobacteriaceae archaeon]